MNKNKIVPILVLYAVCVTMLFGSIMLCSGWTMDWQSVMSWSVGIATTAWVCGLTALWALIKLLGP